MPITYADADLAGCARTLKSISGGQLNFEGSGTCCGIASSSARQTVTADSTPFAEAVSVHTQILNLLSCFTASLIILSGRDIHTDIHDG